MRGETLSNAIGHHTDKSSLDGAAAVRLAADLLRTQTECFSRSPRVGLSPLRQVSGFLATRTRSQRQHLGLAFHAQGTGSRDCKRLVSGFSPSRFDYCGVL